MILPEPHYLKFKGKLRQIKKKKVSPLFAIAAQPASLKKLIQMRRFRSAIYCVLCARLNTQQRPNVATSHKTHYDLEKQLGTWKSFLVSDVEDG